MDGDWQIGHKTAQEYGRLAQETAKAMKQVDNSIELVSCGSSKSDMKTYPDWEAETLKYTYPYVDYVSLHQYYGGQELGTENFLSQSLDMERYIKTVIGTCDYVKAWHRSDKTLYISFDEWGVWSVPDQVVAASVDESPWQVAPHLSEQIYTMEDSLLFAGMMMNFLKYADRIKIACQSLLTNISAAIMTERGGEVWVQPIYYPFMHMANYGVGKTLLGVDEIPCYDCDLSKDVPCVDYAAVYNEEEREVVLFAVNRTGKEAEVDLELQGFDAVCVKEHITMHCEDRKTTNLENHHAVRPQQTDQSVLRDSKVKSILPSFSWNMVRIEIL